MAVLTKLQRNQLFDVVGLGGLEQAACTWADPETNERWDATYAVIRQSSSDSHFMVWPDSSQFAIFKSRMKVGGVEATHNYEGSWSNILTAAQDWARRVVYELEQPDLWAELVGHGDILAQALDADDNSPFTAEEQQAISTRIEEVKAQVRQNAELTDEQISGIEQRLDDLVEASGRVGKKDWKVMLLGTALSIFMADAVPPHVVQMILMTVITGIGHIFGIGGLPPSFPPQA